MANCDSPVKLTVGGKEWYYQTFYRDDGEVEAVRLYDAGGDFVREYSSIYRLTGSLGMMVRRQREEEKRRALKVREEEFPEKAESELGITDEEKAEIKTVVSRRLSELCGDMLSKDFARKVGLSAGVVRLYMLGDRVPTASAIKRIADRCGVSADWILGRTDKTE